MFALVSSGADGKLEARTLRLLAATATTPDAEMAVAREYGMPPPIRGSWYDYSNEDIVLVGLYFVTKHPDRGLMPGPAIPEMIEAKARRDALPWGVFAALFALVAVLVSIRRREA